MVTISILICALAVMIAAASVVMFHLHHKIGYYKRVKAEADAIELTTFASLESCLKCIRRFSAKHYPEGQPRLDMAAYSLAQYLKHMRWLLKKQEDENENVSRSIENAKLNEIEL